MNIGLPLFPRMAQLDLTGPYEVFSHIPGARVVLVGATLDAVSSEKKLRLLPDCVREDCPPLDVLCVPGGSGVNALLQDDAWLDFIAEKGARARFVSSVCTGSLALGAAGLLRGYRATTHWLYLPLLEPFGAIVSKERVVQDRNRFTGAGVTSGIDLALSLTAALSCEETARAIQLGLEYDPAPPFNSGHPSVADPALVERLASSQKEKDYFALRMGLVQAAVTRRATHTAELQTEGQTCG